MVITTRQLNKSKGNSIIKKIFKQKQTTDASTRYLFPLCCYCEYKWKQSSGNVWQNIPSADTANADWLSWWMIQLIHEIHLAFNRYSKFNPQYCWIWFLFPQFSDFFHLALILKKLEPCLQYIHRSNFESSS